MADAGNVAVIAGSLLLPGDFTCCAFSPSQLIMMKENLWAVAWRNGIRFGVCRCSPLIRPFVPLHGR